MNNCQCSEGLVQRAAFRDIFDFAIPGRVTEDKTSAWSRLAECLRRCQEVVNALKELQRENEK
jgi:hypothetical protein